MKNPLCNYIGFWLFYASFNPYPAKTCKLLKGGDLSSASENTSRLLKHHTHINLSLPLYAGQLND